jgi:tRNA nucleotidyltransferase/poly(A) polymerase
MNDLTPREPHRPLIWPDTIPDLQQILAAAGQQVYIVGGAVRDALLHRPLTDIDLAVARDGIKLARRIANSLKGDFFVLDSERDVGRALVDQPDGRYLIDVARFRGDGLLADLTDRDFTINAMAVELTGDISLLIDPLGGEADARHKQVRRCSPHALADDPIRALRAVRQSVQFGMRIEADTLQDIRAATSSLQQVSPERTRDEFVKLLALPKVRMALRVAEALGLLTEIIPETAQLRALTPHTPDSVDGWQETLAIIERVEQLATAISPRRTDHTAATFGIGTLIMQLDRYRRQLQTHIEQQWPNDRPHLALLVLAVLLRDAGQKTVMTRAQALRLSNAERDRLLAMVRYQPLPLDVDELSPLAIHRFWRQTGPAGVDVCLLAAASYLGRSGSAVDQGEWLRVVERLRVLLEAYFERHDELVEPPVLLDGNQLMAALQLARGPIVGVLLDRIREAQVMGTVRSAEDALELARAALGESNHR